MKSPVFWMVVAIGLFFCGILMIVFLTLMSTSSVSQYQGDPTSNNHCAPPSSLVGNTGAEQSWNWFRSLNFDANSTAAILGNEMWESGGTFDPKVHQQGGPGVGIFQWTFTERWQDLLRYASTEGVSPYDLKTQLSFAWVEMQHMNLTPATMNNLGIPTATVVFEQKFEAAGKPQNDKRINEAVQIFNQFGSSGNPVTPITAQCTGTGNATASPTAQNVITEAEKYLGTPYVWGGSDPSGFDCSGLTQYVFHYVGINLPRTAAEQQLVGMRVDPNNVLPGDLVFMGFPAFHVGMYIGNSKWIEAPQTGDVVNIVPYNPNSFTSATRVLQ